MLSRAKNLVYRMCVAAETENERKKETKNKTRLVRSQRVREDTLVSATVELSSDTCIVVRSDTA